MRRKLIIDGNAVYEIDDECARRKEERERRMVSQTVKDTEDSVRKEKSPAEVNTLGRGRVCRGDREF